MKKVFSFVFMLMTLFLWGIPLVVHPESLDPLERQILREWARGRDRSADAYLVLWIRGAPPQKQALSATSLLTFETHIVTSCLGNEECLARYSLLWGRSVNTKTLPVLLLEKRYGVDLSVLPLFSTPSHRLPQDTSSLSANIMTVSHRQSVSFPPQRGIVWEIIGTVLTLPTDLFLSTAALGDGILWPAQ